MFEPEMTDAQLITCLENSRHIDSDKIKKARKVWTPELLEAIAANCTYPLKIIPKKYVTLELVKSELKMNGITYPMFQRIISQKNYAFMPISIIHSGQWR